MQQHTQYTLIIVILGIRRIANGVSETPAWYSMAGHSFGEAVTSSTEFQYSPTHSLKRPLAKVRQRLPQDSAHAYRILCAIYASRIFFFNYLSMRSCLSDTPFAGKSRNYLSANLRGSCVFQVWYPAKDPPSYLWLLTFSRFSLFVDLIIALFFYYFRESFLALYLAWWLNWMAHLLRLKRNVSLLDSPSFYKLLINRVFQH